MPIPEIRSELPKLPKADEWKRATRSFFAPIRSDDLKNLDTALDNYDKHVINFTKHRDEFNEKRDEAAFPQVERAYNDAAVAFEQAARAFDDVNDKITKWGDNHPNRDENGAVTRLRGALEQGPDIIDAGRRQFQADAARLGENVPPTIHQVWLGGVPTPEVIRNAQIWAESHPESDINLWTDRANLLANDFKKHTAGQRTSGSATSSNDPAVAMRISTWDDTSPEQRQAGLDSRLQQLSSPLADKKSEYTQDLAALSAADGPFAGTRIRVRDVSELFEPSQNFPSTPGALTQADRDALRESYQREVGERCNFAAGSDIARLVALHDEPGRYVDIDVTPPIRGFDGLINTWNGALAAHMNQKWNGTEPLATDQPDLDAMLKRSFQLRQQQPGITLPPHINPAKGLMQVENQSYQCLMAAAEEHIARLGSSPPAQPIAPGGPRYNELVEHARNVDPTGRMQQAFDAWVRDTDCINKAFDRAPDLAVGPNLFKAYESGAGRGVNINLAVATSAPAAPALACWAREVSRLTQEAVSTPERKQSYFDDRPENRKKYQDITVETTGPASLTDNEVMRNHLAENYGIEDMTHGMVVIPYHHMPHPMLAHRDHSWLPDQSKALAQTSMPPRREGSLERTISRDSQQPQRRSGSPPIPSRGEASGRSSSRSSSRSRH